MVGGSNKRFNHEETRSIQDNVDITVPQEDIKDSTFQGLFFVGIIILNFLYMKIIV